jgi:hypothetical protein
MQDHYERLGISLEATPAEVKAAYHAKLKEFPAHSHPQEFKAIRAAYDAIRKAPKADDFFALNPIEAELDEELLATLEEKAIAATEITVNDLIILTF